MSKEKKDHMTCGVRRDCRIEVMESGIPPKGILNMYTICLVAGHLDYKALPIVSNELGIIDSFCCKFR